MLDKLSLGEMGPRILRRPVTLSSTRGTTYCMLVSFVPTKIQVDEAAKSEVGAAGRENVLGSETSSMSTTHIEDDKAIARTLALLVELISTSKRDRGCHESCSKDVTCQIPQKILLLYRHTSLY